MTVFGLTLVDANKLDLILKGVRKMVQELEDLKAKVTALEAAQNSAIALLGDLKGKLDSIVTNATDLAELKAGVAAITSQLDTDTQALSAAVAADTPAA